MENRPLGRNRVGRVNSGSDESEVLWGQMRISFEKEPGGEEGTTPYTALSPRTGGKWESTFKGGFKRN